MFLPTYDVFYFGFWLSLGGARRPRDYAPWACCGLATIHDPRYLFGHRETSSLFIQVEEAADDPIDSLDHSFVMHALRATRQHPSLPTAYASMPAHTTHYHYPLNRRSLARSLAPPSLPKIAFPQSSVARVCLEQAQLSTSNCSLAPARLLLCADVV